MLDFRCLIDFRLTGIFVVIRTVLSVQAVNLFLFRASCTELHGSKRVVVVTGGSRGIGLETCVAIKTKFPSLIV